MSTGGPINTAPNISVFGRQPPKIVFNYGLETEVTVLFDYFVLTIDETQLKELTLEEELAANRNFISLGEYRRITGLIYLYQYTTLSAANAAFTALNNLKKQLVVYFPHRDANPMEDVNGNPVLFYLRTVEARNLDALDYRDVVFVELLSTTEVINTPYSYPQ
jgi:hypothetical protein